MAGQARTPSITVFRLLLFGLVVAYLSTLYLWRHPPALSDDAVRYRQEAWDVTNGLNLAYALGRLCFHLGNVAGLVGVVLLGLRRHGGLVLAVVSPPLLATAMVLEVLPTVTWPDLLNGPALLMLCASSALWGAIIAYGHLAREVLFLDRKLWLALLIPVFYFGYDCWRTLF